MKYFVLLVLVAGAFASNKDCPANSHYDACGTACPTTCDNYEDPMRRCVLMCVSGCFCDEGYVQAEGGKCVKKETCVAKRNCVDKPETGVCGGYFPRYYYDKDAKDCKQFIYGGCQGNGNRYETKQQCWKKCGHFFESESDRCSQPVKIGWCKAFSERFYFDKTTGWCKKFFFSGCAGNENNFDTKEDCESACRNDPPCGENEHYNYCGSSCPLTCENKDDPHRTCSSMCKIGCQCKKGFVKRADGKCVRPEQCPYRQDCDKPADPGFCLAYNPRYYYDQEAGKCLKFIYGGCGGNRNNFKTEEECYNKCGALQSFSREICNLEREVGPCRAAFWRYHFNKKTGQCEQFIYGGCAGNENNFETLQECERQCLV